MAQQTAVEWLFSQIPFEWSSSRAAYEALAIAKQMEKEQIMKAVDRGFDEGCKHPEDITLKDAEQYYNETFGNK
jgi:hypothetical protein